MDRPGPFRLRREDGTLAWVPRIVVVAIVAAGAVAAAIDPFTFAFFATYATVGLFLTIRRPANVVSWLLIVIAFGFLGTTSPPTIDTAAVSVGRGSLRDELLVWVGAWSAYLTFFGFAALAIVYPSGHLPTGRWRRFAQAGLVLGVASILAPAIAPTVGMAADADGLTHRQVPNPLALLPAGLSDVPIADVAILLVLLLVVAAVISLLVRYRRSSDVLRLQLRWLLAALISVMVAIWLGLVGSLFEPASQGLEWVPAIVAYPLVPAAIGVAVLRYRLYEIDRIVNRTIVYGSLTAILAGLVAATTAASQKYLTEMTGGSEFGTVVIALVVVTLYTPLRKRIESIVDRYFKYEQRHFGSYREELSRIAALVDPRTAAERLATETLRETRATGVAVLGRDGAVLASAGTWPAEAAARVSVQDAAQIAAVLIGPRMDGRSHPATVIDALATVAPLADVVARAGVLGVVPSADVDLTTAPGLPGALAEAARSAEATGSKAD